MLAEPVAARWRPAIVTDPVRLPRTLVLVGLMGAGKTAIGRRLATRFGLPFVDADHEIEEAAGCSVEDIFSLYGESAFRDVERRVIARLLGEPVHVLATGGGAFIDEGTRLLVAEHGISLWLRADLDILLARTSRRTDRPLLKTANPGDVLARLKASREPVYAMADIAVDSLDGPLEETVDRAIQAVKRYLDDGRLGYANGTTAHC